MAINKRLIAGAPTGGGGACTTNTLQILGDSSCIAYYKMADATDESGSYNGTPTSVDFNVEGKYGLAGGFNGTSSQINLGNSQPFSVTQTGEISISLWVKTTDDAGYLYAKGDDVAIKYEQSLQLNTDGTLVAGIANSAQNFAATINTTATVNDGNWHHVVVTIDNGTSMSVYVDNGTPVTTTSWTGTVVYESTVPFMLGAFEGIPAATSKLNGSLDQIRIFNKKISASEVGTLYAEVQCASAVTPSQHFNIVLYTGNATARTITGVGFQPDFVWSKTRSGANNHQLYDSVRGATKALESNTTSDESTETTALTAFASDGFSLGTSGNMNSADGGGVTYVSWNWYAPTSETNNAGSNGATSQSIIKKNIDAGFSIVKYTGNQTDQHKVYHGLGVVPKMIMLKCTGATNPWYVYHEGVDESSPADFNLRLNTDAARQNSSTEFSDTPPTANLFTLGTTAGTNKNNTDYIAYCFAEKEGYSRIGSYTGTGATGNSIVTGFEPAFVMLKVSTATDNWLMYDNKRGVDVALFANLANAEDSYVGRMVFNSNGFTINTTDAGWNGGSNTYIFMAFAQDPDTTPATKADSFEAKAYSGNGGTQNIVLSNGMKPDFTWIKNRNDTNQHALFDSVRGAGKILGSNTTSAQGGNSGDLLGSFNDDGFQVNRNYLTNTAHDTTNGLSNLTYISWNWKAADHDRSLATINQDGSITSLVSANQASGFSIVKYVGNNTQNVTVGHGLGIEPKMVIIKRLDVANAWWIPLPILGSNQFMEFSTASATTDVQYQYTQTSDIFKFTSASQSAQYNASGGSYVMYSFADIAGYQKVGSYTSQYPNTTSVDVGFQPRFVMIKSYNQARNWVIHDSARTDDKQLYPNLANSEADTGTQLQFTSTGFNVSGGSNDLDGGSSYSYIYLAIA